MEIKLNKLEIRNFKGIREYVMELNGDSAHVYGDNATGKTTLYDAFLWCLFGKNSADQSDDKFDWKPLDEQNNEMCAPMQSNIIWNEALTPATM